MILEMTLNRMTGPALARREKLLRKIRRLWLRTSGRHHPAKLLEVLERRIAERDKLNHRTGSDQSRGGTP